ncbi:hypothetical protein [Streptomyces sp. NPDC020917]
MIVSGGGGGGARRLVEDVTAGSVALDDADMLRRARALPATA